MALLTPPYTEVRQLSKLYSRIARILHHVLSLNMTWSETQCSCVVAMLRGINSKDERGNDNIIACDDNGSSTATELSQQCLLPYKTRRSSNCRSSSSSVIQEDDCSKS